MFHELKELVGHTVNAVDGEIGHIRTFLFDDRTWKVRFLVVDVGRWLTDREVVLPTAALEQPDWQKRICRVRLSKEQVRNSPGIDTEKPVSRQQESAMEEYYGAFGCWISDEFGLSSLPAYREFTVQTAEDRHLRSTSHVLGYEVFVPHGGKACLEGFVLDEERWHLGYLDVKLEEWLSNRSLLIPTGWVEGIYWATHQILTRDATEPVGTDTRHPAKAQAQLETAE
jgi:PRC-barrel domain